MYLKRYYDEEIWKEVELKSPFKEKFKLFVSNYGNLRKLTLETNSEISIKPSLTEGYPSFNLSVFSDQSEPDKEYLFDARNKILDFKNEIRTLNKQLKECDGKNADYYRILKEIEIKENFLDSFKKTYQKKYRKIENNRRHIFGTLVHRLVAISFVEKPTNEHKFVAHLDFDKLNNHHSNLKWMTSDENIKHQQNSPYVIKAKAIANINRPVRITRSKLTIHQVMLIKKQINEDVPLRKLAKRYKVSETQLLRIKRGINWSNIAPAK